MYSDQGLNGMSQAYHTLYRSRLAKGYWRDKERPILINNWEATYFDFDEEKIFEDYYLSDTAYFRLKQAYLAFVPESIFSMEENLKHAYFVLLPENVTRKKNFRMSAKWHFYVIMRAVITRQT